MKEEFVESLQSEFFVKLPPEVIINILSRLPVRSIIHCKCVCKSWLVLIETHEFARSHLSKSALGLAVYKSDMSSASMKIFEFDERLDLERHLLQYNLVIKLDLSYDISIQGSVNGLLFLRNLRAQSNALYIYNPITLERMELRCPREFVCAFPQVVTYGFGVSRVTGQYKVVRIFLDCIRDQVTHALLSIPNIECHTYTLGTGSWRRIGPGARFEYNSRTIGAVLNGNLHWLVTDLKGCRWISCFDLETERFGIFAPPPLPDHQRHLAGVFALEDCLCLCDNSSCEEIVIWTMKEYGVEKSWTKEFVINKVPDLAVLSYEIVCPIKVFKDGDILMKWEDYFLFCYSNKTKTVQKIDIFEVHSTGRFNSILHTPSFLSLRRFELENVICESKSRDRLKMGCGWMKKELVALSSVPEAQIPDPEPIPNEIGSFEKADAGGKGEKKRLNWSREEDVLLTKSYVTISDDPVVTNNDQKATAFWARVASHYNANKPENLVCRDANAIRCHWHNTIQKKVYRFSVDYNNIYSSHRSNHSKEEILRLAYEKYHDEHNGVAFNLEHVWRILKDRPMFAPQSPDLIVGTKKARTSESGASNVSSNQDANIDIDVNEEEDACPVGPKTAKRKGKNKARSDLIDTKTEYNNMIAQLGKLTSLKKAEVEIKKAQIELGKLKAAAAKAKYESKMGKIRMKEYEILQRDTSKMSGFQLEVHEKMCEMIKAYWKMEVVHSYMLITP